MTRPSHSGDRHSLTFALGAPDMRKSSGTKICLSGHSGPLPTLLRPSCLKTDHRSGRPQAANGDTSNRMVQASSQLRFPYP